MNKIQYNGLHHDILLSLVGLLLFVIFKCWMLTAVLNAADLMLAIVFNRPLSRRLDRCDRVIQNESRDPFGGNVYYVTMQITFPTRKFRNGKRNFHCDVVHITTKWVSSLTPDCNGVFAIKAYTANSVETLDDVTIRRRHVLQALRVL